MLQAVDPLRVEAALLDWQRQVRGPAPPGQLLAADGKELRHAQGAQVVTLTHPAGQYYRGSQLVETKSNEIPAVRQLLERVTVAGSLIGIDALHTQQETARQVVQEAGADYLLTVKANQKELRQTLAQRLPKPEQLFPRQSRCRRSGRTRGHRRIGAATKSARSARQSLTRSKPVFQERPSVRSFCDRAWATSPTPSIC